jgi:hypothetical protein
MQELTIHGNSAESAILPTFDLANGKWLSQIVGVRVGNISRSNKTKTAQLSLSLKQGLSVNDPSENKILPRPVLEALSSGRGEIRPIVVCKKI